VVNGGRAQGSGLYRLRDTNGDDQYDEVHCSRNSTAAASNGPHGVVLGPDGKLYVMAGNFTKPPEGLSPDSPHRNWAEDQLLPRAPRRQRFCHGHHGRRAAGSRAPMPKERSGRSFAAVSATLYDLAFNLDGELFTYDADMEWTSLAPWYRPTRVNHCTSAAEFGWRYGSGKCRPITPTAWAASTSAWVRRPA